MEKDMLDSTARQFRSAARSYREIADGVSRALERGPVPAEGEQIVGIVRGSCLPYIMAGADAIDEAAERMEREAAGLADARFADLVAEAGGVSSDAGRCGSSEPLVPPFPDGLPLGFAMGHAARSLEDLLKRLAELAEAVGDRGLTGDTHPYVDVIHGIVVPYLALLAR